MGGADGAACAVVDVDGAVVAPADHAIADGDRDGVVVDVGAQRAAVSIKRGYEKLRSDNRARAGNEATRFPAQHERSLSWKAEDAAVCARGEAGGGEDRPPFDAFRVSRERLLAGTQSERR